MSNDDTERTRKKYRWLWPLTAVNVVALGLAVISPSTPGGLSPLLFPQIWGFSFDGGRILGGITVFAILLTGLAWTSDATDGRDRLYRFFAGVTLASTIMFVTYIVGVAVLLAILQATLH